MYISDTGKLRHAQNLEKCRASFMTNNEAKYPVNPQKEDYEADCDLECEEEGEEKEAQRLCIQKRPIIDVDYPKWLEFIFSGGGPKIIVCECELCPRQAQRNEQQFSSWQDYVGFKWKHMCDEHGPLGANHALMNVPNWIQNYTWKDPNKKDADLIFGSIAKAGFTQCGQMEQGVWKSLPGCEQGLYEAGTNLKREKL